MVAIFTLIWNQKYFQFIIIIIIIIITSNTAILAQTSNETDKNTDVQESSLSKSLSGLYKLSQDFIIAISGNGFRDIIEEALGLNFTNPSSFSSFSLTSINFNSFSQKAALSGAGYIVIIAIGIVFILFFLVSCLSLFCCRKLGCCCGKLADGVAKSSDFPVASVLLALMIAVTVMMALSAYGSIASGIVAVESLKDDEKSGLPLVGNLLPAVRELPVFINNTIQEIDKQLNVNELVDRYFGNFSEMLKEFIEDELTKCGPCSDLLADYRQLISYVNNISTLIDSMDRIQTNLRAEYSNFNSSLDDFKARTLQALGNDNCTAVDPCEYLKRNVSILYLLRNDSIQFLNFSSIKSDLQYFKSFEKITTENLTSITDSINNVTTDFLETIRNQFDNLKRLLNENNVYDLENKYLNINSSFLSGIPWPTVKQFSNTAVTALKAVAIAIGSIFFLIILLNIIGMILIPVCIKQSPKTSEKMFLASSQISFLFGAIFCIISILVFIIGAPMHREVCFDVKKQSDSYYLKALDVLIQEELKKTNFSYFRDFKIKFEPEKLFLLTRTIETQCKNNESLTNAIFDVIIVDNDTVNGILNMTTPAIKDALKDFDLSKLPIFSDDIINKLNESAKSIDHYNFSEFDFTAKLLSIDLDVIEQLMTDSQNEDINNKTQMHELVIISLPGLKATAKNITDEEEMLRAELRQVEYVLEITSDHLVKMANYTLVGRSNVGNISSDTIFEDLTNALRDKFWEFYNYLKAKLSEAGKCRKVYDIFNFLFSFFCDRVVNPVNAYWFTLGIGIVLLIPSFLFGLSLGGLFARRNKLLEEGSEDGDDEFENVKSSDYLNRNLYRPQVPPVGGAFGDQPPQNISPPSGQSSPNRNSPNSDDVENASIYYIPSFPTNQQQPRVFNPPRDSYYNMPYTRIQQPDPQRPFSRPEIRIPRPWRPRSNGFVFPQYSRF